MTRTVFCSLASAVAATITCAAILIWGVSNEAMVRFVGNRLGDPDLSSARIIAFNKAPDEVENQKSPFPPTSTDEALIFNYGFDSYPWVCQHDLTLQVQESRICEMYFGDAKTPVVAKEFNCIVKSRDKKWPDVVSVEFPNPRGWVVQDAGWAADGAHVESCDHNGTMTISFRPARVHAIRTLEDGSQPIVFQIVAHRVYRD